MNELLQTDYLADLAREHQADMLRIAQADGHHRSLLSRWRNSLIILVVLGAPVAYFLVRGW